MNRVTGYKTFITAYRIIFILERDNGEMYVPTKEGAYTTLEEMFRSFPGIKLYDADHDDEVGSWVEIEFDSLPDVSSNHTVQTVLKDWMKNHDNKSKRNDMV